MAKVELKQPVVEEISAGIKDAQSVVLVDYRGLTVEQDTQLRKSLREAGVSYKVYKNTMMNFAFKGTQFEGLSEYLEGPSAMSACVITRSLPFLGRSHLRRFGIRGGTAFPPAAQIVPRAWPRSGLCRQFPAFK